MLINNLVTILESYPNQKVILTMITKQEFKSEASWGEAYHGRSKIDWNIVSKEMSQFYKEFEFQMDINMPLGFTASDSINFLNTYFIGTDRVIANIFTKKDFPMIPNDQWVSFATIINDDFPTDKIIDLTL